MTASMHDAACVKKNRYGRVDSVQSNAGEQEFEHTSGSTIRLANTHWPVVVGGVVTTSYTISPMTTITARPMRAPRTMRMVTPVFGE
jgi:hypothetical protein